MHNVVPAAAPEGSADLPPERFEAKLSAALEDAHLPSLLAALVQLTGDFSLLEGEFRPRRRRGPGDHDEAGLSPTVQAALRDKALRILMAHRDGRLSPAPNLAPAQVLRILSTCLSEPVPAEEADMLAEELGVLSRRPTRLEGDEADRAPRVLIIGTGFSGLCAAIRLDQAGIPYEIIERNHEVGGTWFENRYPGCGVDTPVHLYSFSFAQRGDWPRYFARQEEVQKYLIDVAESTGVRDRVRFGTQVEAARWDDSEEQWVVRVKLPDGSHEEIRTSVVISAVGLFNRPARPHLPGLDAFPGRILHTGAWDDSADLTGKRIAVIGSGASAMQFVPAVVDVADHVTVFQRSPQWILPNPNTNREVSEEKQFLMTEVPGYLAWYRLQQAWNFGDRLHPMLRIDPEWPHPDRSINADNERHRLFLTAYIEKQLEGRPDLVEKCTPTYPPYGKRPLLDHGWFEALKRENVTLVADKVERLDGNTVVSAGGERATVDIVVLATGFETLNMLGPLDVQGRGGKSLREFWGPDDARAFLGMTIPDFPNFFILYGPNTNAGHGGSHVLSVEMQVRYVLQLLERMAKERLTSVESRRESFETYNRELDEALEGSIWSHRGMTTYYRNDKGRIVTNLPWTNAEYWHRTRYVRAEDFLVRGETLPNDSEKAES